MWANMCQNIPNNFQLGFAKVRWLEKTKKNTLPKWWFDWFDGEETPIGSNPQQNHQLNKQKYTTTSQPNWRTKPSQLKAVAHHFSKRWGAIATARSKHWELLLRCMAPWKSNGSTLLEGICTIPYNALSHPYRRKEKTNHPWFPNVEVSYMLSFYCSSKKVST